MRAPDTLPPEVERDLAAMDAAVAGLSHPGGDPLLAELAALVAESRPELDADRARALDQRAAAAFAKPAAGRRTIGWRRMLAPAAGLAACATIALAIGLANTGSGPAGSGPATSGGESAGSSASKAAPALGTGSSASGGGAGGGSSASGGGAGGGSSSSSSDRSSGPTPATAQGVPAPPVPVQPGGLRAQSRTTRKVERSATMTLGTPRSDVDAVASGVARVTTTLGGYVASSSISSRTGGYLELRIPSGRLDAAIEQLGRLAHIRRLERNTLDITAQSVSARARIAELTAERRSVLGQLAKAVTLDEIDRLKARLRTVNNRLQSARAQSKRIDQRAAFASLSVEIVGERRAAAASGWSPGQAWHDALRVLEVAAGIALVAFAVALPLVLLGAPAWLAGRRLARRRRERALDLA